MVQPLPLTAQGVCGAVAHLVTPLQPDGADARDASVYVDAWDERCEVRCSTDLRVRGRSDDATMSERPAKRSRKKRALDPRLEAHRLMEEFVDADETSQVHTRDIALRVAAVWALLSIADSLATSNAREGMRGTNRR